MENISYSRPSCRSLYLHLLNPQLKHDADGWLYHFQRTKHCDYINDLSKERVAIVSYINDSTLNDKQKITEQCYIHYYTWNNRKLLRGISSIDRLKFPYNRKKY